MPGFMPSNGVVGRLLMVVGAEVEEEAEAERGETLLLLLLGLIPPREMLLMPHGGEGLHVWCFWEGGDEDEEGPWWDVAAVVDDEDRGEEAMVKEIPTGAERRMPSRKARIIFILPVCGCRFVCMYVSDDEFRLID